jgi:hypothetical protein
MVILLVAKLKEIEILSGIPMAIRVWAQLPMKSNWQI